MANRVKLSFPRNSNVNFKGLQREAKPSGSQQIKLRTSQIAEARAKFKQIGKGKQNLKVTTPMFGNSKVIVKKETKDGGKIR